MSNDQRALFQASHGGAAKHTESYVKGRARIPSLMAGDSSEHPDEEVDLDEKRRKYIVDAFAQLDRLNHYALLGIARTADKKAIKAAYYRLAGLVHPDRYFGKRLGSYKPKMEAVFAAISSA